MFTIDVKTRIIVVYYQWGKALSFWNEMSDALQHRSLTPPALTFSHIKKRLHA